MPLRKALSEAAPLEEINLPTYKKLVSIALLSTSAITLVGFILVFQEVLASPTRLTLTIGTLLLNFAGWLYLRKGRLIAAGRILIGGYWLICQWLIVISGGLDSPWLMLEFSITVLAGVLLGGTSALILMVLNLISNATMYSLQVNALLVTMPFDERFLDNGLAIISNAVLISISILAAGYFWQSSLRQSRDNDFRYRALFGQTNDAVFVVDSNENIADANEQALSLLGYQREEMIGKPYSIVLPPIEREKSHSNFDEIKAKGYVPLFERTLACKDGSQILVEFNGSAVRDDAGELRFYLGVARDIRERKRLEQELRYSLDEMESAAMHDALTGLLNRRAITQYAEIELSQAEASQRPISLVLVDVDDLKRMNDTHGHAMGDKLIVKVGSAIKDHIRRNDFAGRWGGDEFMIVLPGANLVHAEEISERLRATIEKVDEGDEIDLPSVSIGISCFSGRGKKAIENLFSETDEALYTAKRKGKSRTEVYRSKERAET